MSLGTAPITPSPSLQDEYEICNQYSFRPISPAISVWTPTLSPSRNYQEVVMVNNSVVVDDNYEDHDEDRDPYGILKLAFSFDEWDHSSDRPTTPLSAEVMQHKPIPRRQQEENRDDGENCDNEDDGDDFDDPYGTIKMMYSFDEWNKESRQGSLQEGRSSIVDDRKQDDCDDDDEDPYGSIRMMNSFDEWDPKKPKIFRFDEWDETEEEDNATNSEKAQTILNWTTSSSDEEPGRSDVAIQWTNTTSSTLSSILIEKTFSGGAFRPVKIQPDQANIRERLTPLDTWLSSPNVLDHNDNQAEVEVFLSTPLHAEYSGIPRQEQSKNEESLSSSSSSWQRVHDIPKSIEFHHSMNYDNSDQYSIESSESSSSTTFPIQFHSKTSLDPRQPPSIPDFVLLQKALSAEQPPLQLQKRPRSWCRSVSRSFSSVLCKSGRNNRRISDF